MRHPCGVLVYAIKLLPLWDCVCFAFLGLGKVRGALTITGLAAAI